MLAESGIPNEEAVATISRILIFTLLAVGIVLLAFGLTSSYIDLLDITFIGFFLLVGLLVIWVGALVDIWRRTDLSTVPRVFWSVAIIIFPILATLIYVIARPPAERLVYRGDVTA